MMIHRASSPLLNVEDVLPVLNQITIFGSLTESELYSLFRLLERVSYRSGEYVFQQGEEPSQIYIILSGKVKIVAEEEDTTLELVEFGVGQCFGETSVIAIQPHAASALAAENTELIVLTRETLLSIFDSNPELFGKLVLNIAREACRRLHNTDETILHYFCKKKR
jgi:CRP-like cAMP-binding protein